MVLLCLATIIVSVKETLQAVSFATYNQIYRYCLMQVMRHAKLCYYVQCRAVLSLSIHHNGGKISGRFGEILSLLEYVSTTINKHRVDVNYEASNTDHGWNCAEFTSKDSDFEWRSSVLFLLGSQKIPSVSNAALLYARATVSWSMSSY